MRIEVANPRTGQVDYRIEVEGEAQLRARAQSLRSAQSGWAELSAAARGEILMQWARSIEEHRASIRQALSKDTGRNALSDIEIDSVLGMIRRWAKQAPALIEAWQSEPMATSLPTVTTRTTLVPYPLIGVISPWNFPLTLSIIDAIPALAAGCAVMIKPSEITPRFVEPLQESLDAVPRLASVLALVQGDGATGAALVDQVDFICFTGSVPTGRKVAEAAARAFIPASLELGGKDPMIILASADPDQAAEIALRSSIVNNGQACQSIERIFVDRTISEPFLESLVARAGRISLNHPDPHVGDIGPFIFARQAAIVEEQVEDALARGAQLLAGGEVERLDGGLYLRPTILANVTPDMKVMTDETFGPVLPIMTFGTVDEAVELANSGHYGLSAAVIAGTAGEAEAVGERLDVGAVSINDGSLTGFVWEAEKTSFRQSGLGPSRMGDAGLLRFLRKRLIMTQSGRALGIEAFAERSRI